MAEGPGGYRAPKNPAPVSGPGAQSKRTDGIKSQSPMDMPDAAYGEQKEMRGIQGAAPMAAASMPKITPLDAPTQRPDEPVTSGMDRGPGPGRASIGMTKTSQQQSAMDASQIAAYLPALEQAANRPGVPTSFVRFVRHLRSFA
ncbi:MAG: hypothetical protein CL556_12220 [Alphaproteobacteria bacterium]|nr:hypothetical protein [Alphaproteobacteria bacterium]|tara:strand:+ start:7000 stop:7431 length:432 start_codon:yes stop_codon:yes gene_type:complete